MEDLPLNSTSPNVVKSNIIGESFWDVPSFPRVDRSIFLSNTVVTNSPW